MVEQVILSSQNEYLDVDIYIRESCAKRILLVCGQSIHSMKIGRHFDVLAEKMGIEIVKFTEFHPNPSYESVVAGVQLFKKAHCDFIIAVGGGSAIDVAKCIKLFSNMDDRENYLTQKIVPNQIPFLVMPTTAGTGSEATRFAVIYYKGEKQSISDESCVPNVVLMEPDVLETLPLYHKKATMMDALCHAIESYWSVLSTDTSKEFARQAINTIIKNKNLYLANNKKGNAALLKAAHLAGKAINISQTTAGHAMSYKLTSLYRIAHGHAVALCVAQLWPFMMEHLELCIDCRGEKYLNNVLNDIAKAMGCKTVEDAVLIFNDIVNELFPEKIIAQNADYEILNASVNPIRLKNNPIKLDDNSLDYLYHQILK